MSVTALTPFRSWLSPLANIFSIPLSLIPSILWAVPKKRTTHSTKRQRMTQKWLRPMKNIIQCPLCGSATLLHHSCKMCLRGLKNNPDV
ncbi:hypothetical protein HDU78_006122 [Chytriomyces hyalinus]|nr:hypothetical protein HDU78_006122 [Chytriomyces hyalinus]KAJ3264915.1 hypothetical protein HDU77_007195 [Chytriomyces hyalinus]